MDFDGMMEKDLMEVDREALIKQEKDVQSISENDHPIERIDTQNLQEPGEDEMEAIVDFEVQEEEVEFAMFLQIQEVLQYQDMMFEQIPFYRRQDLENDFVQQFDQGQIHYQQHQMQDPDNFTEEEQMFILSTMEELDTEEKRHQKWLQRVKSAKQKGEEIDQQYYLF